MNPMLLAFLLECLPRATTDPEAIYVAACAVEAAADILQAQGVADQVAPPEPEARLRADGVGHTLTIARATGRSAQFVGTGYHPLPDLGAYRICVHGERVVWRSPDPERDDIRTQPWTKCRPVGFVDADGVLRFSETVDEETTAVCIELRRSFRASTERIPGARSGLGTPTSVWRPRQSALACVRFGGGQ